MVVITIQSKYGEPIEYRLTPSMVRHLRALHCDGTAIPPRQPDPEFNFAAMDYMVGHMSPALLSRNYLSTLYGQVENCTLTDEGRKVCEELFVMTEYKLPGVVKDNGLYI